MRTPGSRWNKKNPPPSWQSFSYPLSPPSFLSRPSSFPLCLRFRYVSLSHFRCGASRGISLLLFSMLLFSAFTPTPCLPLAAATSFLLPVSCVSFVGAPTAFDSFWAELAWPLAKAQTRTRNTNQTWTRFNPLGLLVTPRLVGWVRVGFLSTDYSWLWLFYIPLIILYLFVFVHKISLQFVKFILR